MEFSSSLLEIWSSNIVVSGQQLNEFIVCTRTCVIHGRNHQESSRRKDITSFFPVMDLVGILHQMITQQSFY